MGDDALLAALGRVAQRFAGGQATPERLSRPGAGALIVRCGPVVLKAHAAGTVSADLAARLAVASLPAMAPVLLAPVESRPAQAEDRLVSVWPYGATVPTDPAKVPWADAGALLARLHTCAPGALSLRELPSSAGPLRIADLVSDLAERSGRPSETVRTAWRSLPPWARGEAPVPGPVTVVHGDWHLGQLVRPPGDAGWRLVDLDDLGQGSPIWDFGKVAALRALGVVREGEFRTLLNAYWAAGGPALLPGSGGPADSAGWAALDTVAQAHVVSAAARRLTHPGGRRRYRDGLTDDLLRACTRLAAEGN